MSKVSSVRRIIAVVFTLMLMAPAFSASPGRATADEAKAVVAKAIAIYDRDGRKAAFAAIEDPKGGLVDRDLYVFVFGPKRTVVAHGSNPALVGTDVDGLVDEDGVHFGTRFMDEATASGTWIDYKWHDPVSATVLPKSSWLVRHDGYVFGAGIYTPE
jgi:signal transduction histidine kinase